MKFSRRQCLQSCGLVALATLLPPLAQNEAPARRAIGPARLRAGDTVGLINPAAFSYQKELEPILKILPELGLNVKFGTHLLDRYGYLGGQDKDRAADVNAMFADRSVKAIFTVQGGWGCNRILPLLDYELIQKNPKILMGFSDITSLLLAIHAKTGLVTFHGPLGISSWSPFTVNSLKTILFAGEAATLRNSALVKPEILGSGKTRGKLLGGNLSVLAAMVGSSYLPRWDGAILFLEEVGEEVYRVDRLLTQLKLAGILDRLSGFIFGQCSKCDPENPEESLSLKEVLFDHISPLKIPAWYGSAIGHVRDIFTLPVGGEVEIDANTGTIQLLEPAVT